MKKMIIIIVLLILLQFMFFSMNTLVLGLTNPAENPDEYKPTDLQYDDYNITVASFSTIIKNIRNIGIIIAVIAVMVLGVKYILGSVEEKAEYKATMIPIVIGIFMLASILTIVSIIYDISNSILGS